MIVRKLMLLAFLVTTILCGQSAHAQVQVTDLSITGSSPTNDTTLTWLVTFSEPVTGVSTANFELATTGVTANLASVTALPGNYNWILTADGISGDGTLGANLSDPAGISGASGDLEGTLTGETYQVDTIRPFVVSISPLDPSPTVSTEVSFEVVFSEPVSGPATGNFALGGSGATGTIIDVTPAADPTTWHVQVGSVSGAGLLTLDLVDTFGIVDDTGNWLQGDFTSGDPFEIAPQLLCISLLDGSPTSAMVVRYGLTFNAPVAGLTDANIITTGPAGAISDITVLPVGGAEPAAEWIVAVGSISGNGTVEIALQNPASITEPNGVSPVSLEPVNCSETVYIIDQTAPVASCISGIFPVETTPSSNTDTVRFSVTFTEAVAGVSESNFNFAGTDLLTFNVEEPVSTDGGLTWVLEVTGIAENVSNSDIGRIEVSWANSDGILDSSGNQAALPAVCPPMGYDIDQRGPELICVTREPADADEPTSAGLVTFLLTFDEPVASDSVTSADLQVLLEPQAGFAAASIEEVAAVGGVTSATEFITTVSVVGDNSTTIPFVYGDNSVGNGYVSVGLDSGTSITDVAGNPVALPVQLSDLCGNTSYTIDQVRPFVTTATLNVNDCMSSAIFTISFSENVTTLTEGNVTIFWSGGPCANPLTTTTINRVSETTFTVEVHGYYEQFHQNGPGLLSLMIDDPSGVILDAAGNGLASSFNSESYDICRCFEPVVGVSPRALTEPRFYDTELTTDCPGADECTTVGLETSYGDLPTIGSYLSSVTWFATEWDCGTSAPFSVYIDDQFTSTTDGGVTTSLAGQLPPGTTNSLCFPIGTSFTLGLDVVLPPGLHTYRVDIDGACAPGTTMYFNVLDAPVPTWPVNNLPLCSAPPVYGWDGVEGALGYEVFLRRVGSPCFDKIGSVTSDTQLLDSPTPPAPIFSGNYEWFVRAYNEYGHHDSALQTFTVTPVNPFVIDQIRTNGTVYDVQVSGTLTFVAGDFTLVQEQNGGPYHARQYLAAFDSLTGELMPPLPVLPNNAVYTMKLHNDDMYIGGTFTVVDSTPMARIARLTLDPDSGLGWDYYLDQNFRPGANDTVRAIEIAGDHVYYAGDFTRVGFQVYNFSNFERQVRAERLAMVGIDPDTNPDVVQSTSTAVHADASIHELLLDGNQLYIAGAFSEIGNQPIRALARATLTTTATIDASFDLNIQSDISHYVYSLDLVDDILFIGGSFTSVHEEQRRNAAAIEVSRTTTTTTLLPWDPQAQGAVMDLKYDPNTRIVLLGGLFTVTRNVANPYLVGVDPVLGMPVTCNLQQGRAVYAIDSFLERDIPVRLRLKLGGLSP